VIKKLLFLTFNLFSFIVLADNLPYVAYPFQTARGILCDQGAQSPVGNSHTHLNTLYALDLATPKGADAAGIYASSDALVIAYGECKDFNTNCGAGFGNHIKLLREDGILIMYAHLKKVAVKTGDKILKGDFIGVEGNTGLTGQDNRHLHFSVHADWRIYGAEYFKMYLGSLPDSIPYRMNICQQSYGTCNGQPLDIRKLKCRRITKKTEWVQSFPICVE